MASILCFMVSLVLGLPPVVVLLSERVASAVQTAALCGTYLLSGLPQLVSSIALVASGNLDTHVLMALAVAATLYLGMVQEVRWRCGMAGWFSGQERGGPGVGRWA